jgi:hypothetical protein
MTLQDTLRIIASNAIPKDGVSDASTEPAVYLETDTLEAQPIFGGVMRRTVLGNTAVPANNDLV